jgi:TrmH family RNA methyltransferase
VPPREVLRSRRHALVERFRQLARKRDRSDPAVLLDGWHLVGQAVSSGTPVEIVVLGADASETPEGTTLLARCEAAGIDVALASRSVIEAASPTAAPTGVVAIAQRHAWTLEDVLRPAPALVFVTVAVQDPGNLGAIVRVADAAGATGVVATGHGADPFGWKALRGAMGSGFRLPLVSEVEPANALGVLRHAGVRVLATASGHATPLDAADLRGPVAIVLGNEGAGVPPEIMTAADEQIAIPMRRGVESLNVATAAAVIAYEARRQRGES